MKGGVFKQAGITARSKVRGSCQQVIQGQCPQGDSATYSRSCHCINFTIFPHLRTALGNCFVETQHVGFLDGAA